ncbi:MAG: ATP-binding protein [Chloroflexota bacterium]
MKLLITVFFALTISIRLSAATEKLDNYKRQLSVLKKDTTRIPVLFKIFDHYRYRYPDSALPYISEALDIAERFEDEHTMALCSLFLSETFSMLGNDPQALNYGFKALTLFEKQKDTMGICNTSTSIGNFYSAQRDFKKSLFYYHKALKLLDLYSDKSTIHYFWGGISGIYLQNNQVDSAMYYAVKAYKKDPAWGYGLRLMALAYERIGNNSESFVFYRKALKSARNLNLLPDLVDIYSGMAKLHQKTGRADSAIYYANKALSITREGSYPSGILEVTTMLASIYELNDQQDSALKYLKLSLKIKDELYNSEKVRAFQNISFNEELRQEDLAKAKIKSRNRLILYLLSGGFGVLVIISLIVYKNRRQKEKVGKELEMTQTQLIQSEKMASLGELTAGIAHEIKNPLNFVTNFSEVSGELLDDMKIAYESGNNEEGKLLYSEITENLKRINHHGKRADAIVKGMLYHSRTSSGIKEPTNINALADEYLRLTYHGLRARDKTFNAVMKSDYDQSIGSINVMPQELGRVILNLLSNAFYAVNEKITANGYVPTISVSTRNLGKNIELRISDNGIGIPQKVLDKIFQPFFTTKPTGEGTGLGLSLSYDIITKGHGGKLSVETNEGEGTRFIIILPR